MERGLWDEATKLKDLMETQQRSRRKEIVKRFEETKIPNGPSDYKSRRGLPFGEEWWVPRWFVR